MRFTIPIYVQRDSGGFEVSPLFFKHDMVREKTIKKAQRVFAKKLRKTLEVKTSDQDHFPLVPYTFCPDFDAEDLVLDFSLQSAHFNRRLYFVTYRSMNRRIAFSPSLPDFTFTVERGEDLRVVAARAVKQEFTRMLKKGEVTNLFGYGRPLDSSKPWTAILEIDVPDRQKNTAYPLEDPEPRAGSIVTQHNGYFELRKVGRELRDWDEFEDRDRIRFRSDQTSRLRKNYHHPDARPMVVLGARGSGRTAVILSHIQEERTLDLKGRGYWHLSPGRIISGMSTVGEWESRMLSIIEECREHKHVIYIDDLPGLFSSGKSRDSDFTIGQLIKPYIARGRVSILAEATEEEWRIIREMDRGFADLFEIVRVPVMDPDQVLQTILSEVRELEREYQCRFASDAIVSAPRLLERHMRDVAFPGKAVRFLRQLAMRHPDEDLTREVIFKDFSEARGVRREFLDREAVMMRDDVLKILGGEVIGQPDAVDRAADAIMLAKAGLCDPDRPLATFLFLGPTGVGKTQLAKAVSSFLFPDQDDRLLRFDMNEYTDFGAAGRLVGTFNEPDGLLTKAAQEHPFAVLLLDEIEKAHPEVLDVLLSAIGEGRLTDARGQTADLTQMFIIMTSNIGSREASTEFGFESGKGDTNSTYRKAAEGYFRPEFFNRIDHIIPFRRLDRDDMEGVAQVQMRMALDRDGFLRRRIVLRIDRSAHRRVVDAGFHPEFGARAIKRSIESEMTQTLADYLAAIEPRTPTLVRVAARSDRLIVSATPFMDPVPFSSAEVVMPELDELKTKVELLLEELAARAPASGSLSPDDYAHFQLVELARELKNHISELTDKPTSLSSGVERVKISLHGNYDYLSKQNIVLDLLTKETYESLIDFHLSQFENVVTDDIDAIHLRWIWINELAECRRRSLPGSALFYFIALCDYGRASEAFLQELKVSMVELCRKCDISCDAVTWNWGELLFHLTGPGAETIAEIEEGIHILTLNDGGMIPICGFRLDLAEDVSPKDRLNKFQADQDTWRYRLISGEAEWSDDPLPFPPVIRLLTHGRPTIDMLMQSPIRRPAIDLRTQSPIKSAAAHHDVALRTLARIRANS